MNPRCPFCRVRNCDPCPKRLAWEQRLFELWNTDPYDPEPWTEWDDIRYAELQREHQGLPARAPAGPTLLVWFVGSEAAQHQNLTRLAAEWPYALEVIEPTIPGDLWGARLARDPRDIGENPIEFEVSEGYVQRDDGYFWGVLGRVFDRTA